MTAQTTPGQITPGGFAGDPAEAFTPPAAGGCCGGPAAGTDTASTAAAPCCGTAPGAEAAGSCCAPAAKAEAVGSSAGCCG